MLTGATREFTVFDDAIVHTPGNLAGFKGERFYGLGCRVSGGLRFRVWGLGVRV